ncbi:hypothetical protein ACJMK2_036707 [Sinanodonta woodiana]|uniref:Retinol dehydrogenase 11 n=1 Tax=Sinanodonta woodiana TaxID=1069815 RepID=A0ABD3WJW6_SINWO
MDTLDLESVLAVLEKSKTLLLSAVAIGLGVVVIRRYCEGGKCLSNRRLDGKTVIVTGANCGLGKETARELAKRGARVILACRDLARAETAAEEIRLTTGNRNVQVYMLDLASLKSVHRFAEEIIKNEDRLDILINNAAVSACPKQNSEEGYELQFAVNHLGHFLLTNLLLNLLKKSAPSRVVTVSALAHVWCKQIHFEDLSLEKNYTPWYAYCHSKLANILFNRELSRRLLGTGVTTYALHPGIINTELMRYRRKGILVLSWYLFCPLTWLLMKSTIQGIQTTIYCAVSEDLEGVSGRYYSDCKEKQPYPQACDDDAAVALWEISEKLTGLSSKLQTTQHNQVE